MVWNFYNSVIKVNGVIRRNNVKNIARKIKLSENRRKDVKVISDELSTYYNLKYDNERGLLDRKRKLLLKQLEIKYKMQEDK